MDEINTNANNPSTELHNDTLYRNIRDTLSKARSKVYVAINFAMVEAYWSIGQQIEEGIGIIF